MRRGLLVLGVLTASLTVPATSAQATTPSGFTVAHSANLGGVAAYLTGITTPTPTAGWIIGSLDRRTHPKDPWALMEQWNGTSWSRIGLPSLPPNAYQTYLVSISSTTPTDAWAVGLSVTPKAGPGSQADHQLVYRRTAAGWKRVTITTTEGYRFNRVTSVSVGSPTSVWAVADDDGCDQYLLHYDGARWSVVDSEDECDAGSGTAYDQVAAAGPSVAWGVGNGCSDYCAESGGLAYCFGPACPAGSGLGYVGFGGNFWNAGGTVSNFWAFGYQQVSRTFEPMIYHWDGTSWQDATPTFAGTSQTVADGVVLPDGDLWTAGHRTTSGGDRTLILEHGSGGWQQLGATNSGTAANDLASIAHVGGTATEMWAVGSAGNQPLLLHHP